MLPRMRIRTPLAAIALGLGLCLGPWSGLAGLHAQSPATASALAPARADRHPVSGRVFARPMGVEGAAWLERPERISEERPDDAIRYLKLRKGMVVADIGAGSGYFTTRMARLVGPTGKVYAEDVQPAMLDILRRTVAREKLTNVEPVLGELDDPKLPDGAIDLAIMVDVYHELWQPQVVLRKLRRALKPSGRLVLLEYRGEDLSIPIIPEHKMTRRQAQVELEAEGFRLADEYEGLPRQHLFVFVPAVTNAQPGH